MKRYWINPNYKVREEYWGSLAYYLEDITWEIGPLATNILKNCNGKTEKEIAKLHNISPIEIKNFLKNALNNNLLITKKPEKVREVILRSYKEDFCLTSPTGIFFEITYRCNMRCKHCYTSSYNLKTNEELSTFEIYNLIKQASKMGVFVFSIGGGEPFMRKDIIPILEYGIKNNLEMIPVTNGFFLNAEIIKKLKSIGIRQVVVSLDGSTKEIYKSIRGNDIFDKVLTNINLLVKNKIRVLINCVVNKNNLFDLEAIIKLVKKKGVNAIRFIRLTPFGRAKENQNLWLNNQDYMYFVKELYFLSKKYTNKNFKVIKDEAFLGLFNTSNEKKRMTWLPDKYSGCPAGRSFIFIDPYGKVYPCGYLEFDKFLIGDIKDESLEDIWQNKKENKILNFFRKITKLNEYCEKCKNKSTCQGGCRATAYMKYKNLLAPDALCFREIINQEENQVRKVENKDFKEISNLIIRNLKEINSKDYNSEIINLLIKDYEIDSIKRKSLEGNMIVILKKDEIVGVGRFFDGNIFDVFVLPEYHNMGIGKIIIQHLENIAKNEGYREISLPSSKTAILFYKKLGYNIKKQQTNSKSSYWMSKEI